jgi:hypothetical protein
MSDVFQQKYDNSSLGGFQGVVAKRRVCYSDYKPASILVEIGNT